MAIQLATYCCRADHIVIARFCLSKYWLRNDGDKPIIAISNVTNAIKAPKILSVCCDGSHLFHVPSCAFTPSFLNTGTVLFVQSVEVVDRQPLLLEPIVEDVATDAGGVGSVGDAPFRRGERRVGELRGGAGLAEIVREPG